nr:dof zinc finger protein DOF1.2-like [Ipomoea batatas]
MVPGGSEPFSRVYPLFQSFSKVEDESLDRIAGMRSSPHATRDDVGCLVILPVTHIICCCKKESYDTKFRYFNNYNVNQPRYYCRTCRRHWTHGGAQHDIPRGGRSHKGKRSTRRHENQRIQLAPPSLPQLQPLNPSTIVAPPPFISPMVPPMMTPYHVSGGFFPPMVEEEIAQPQQCEAESGYLNWVNPLNIVDQSFPQLTNRHSDSCMESYRLNNNEASSSNVVPLDASMGKISTTNGGTNVSWDSSFVDLDK